MAALPVPPEAIVIHEGAPLTVHEQVDEAVIETVAVDAVYPNDWLVGVMEADAHGLEACVTLKSLSAMVAVLPRPPLVVFSATE